MGMRYERTQDFELIRSVMTHPRVYPHITDDGCLPADEFRPVEHPALWYIAVRDGDEPLGLFLLVPQNAVCWEIHTCLLPSAWGGRSKAVARELGPWLWQNTACRRVVTNVPVYNRLALHLARAAGMREFGINEKSYMKNGKLYDQILLGVSKPEEV